MNALLSPVGPRSASVYWRRRLAVLAAVVVLLLFLTLVVRVLTGGGDAATAASREQRTAGAAGGTQAAPEPSAPEQPATATATATASSDQPGPCDAAAVQLSATSDASRYETGRQPKLGVLIRNVGTAACTLEAGSKAVELVVVSGTDRVWSSDDCQRDPTSKVQTLAPGAELASTVTWSVQRSAEGCPGGLPALGAGTYQLTGRVGDMTSQPLTFSMG
ncbi:MAG: hypothetical protein ACLGIA_11925 [Actinomycetes bacterium]